MNLTQAAIRFDRVTAVAVILLVIAGISSYRSLPKSQNPSFVIRAAVVTTYFPGASPERVELLVTDAIEQEIQEMPEIDFISSESRTGISIVTANFLESYTDMRPIFDDLRRKVEGAALTLPGGAATPHVNTEFGDTFGHVYTLRGDGFSAAELDAIADEIRDVLLGDTDIAKVDIYGAQDEAIFIEYSNSRLTELGLSPQQLSSRLQALNILSSGGELRIGPEMIVLEPTGNFESVEDLRRSVIQLPGSGELVYLEDIVSIRRAYADPASSLVHVNGERALTLAIAMREGGNILELGRRLQALMPELEAGYPVGITIAPLFLQSTYTTGSVDAFVSNLGQAVAIVIVVMVLTLGFRTGLVVASLIPIVMVSTFFIMSLFDIGVNQISLAALIIALGLLVDNAIVVVEATIVRRQRGEEATVACIAAAREMMLPLLISSLTTAMAFAPIALAESNVGEFASSIFYVVTMALLLSWLVSMTFIPMMTRLIKVEARSTASTQAPGSEDNFSGRYYRVYRNLLHASLHHPAQFGVIVLGLFVAALIGMGYVPQVFIPPSEDPVLTVKLEYPLGTSIETTESAVEDLESHLRSLQAPRTDAGSDVKAGDVLDWVAYIGTGGPRFVLGFTPPNPDRANANFIVNLSVSAALDRTKAAIEAYVFENHPDLKVQVKRLSNGPPVSYPIEVRVSGRDFGELYTQVDAIRDRLWANDKITDVKDSWGPQSKKLIIGVDQARALRAGVTSSDIAVSLNASLSGMQLTEYREGDESIPVTMRTLQADREDLTRLDSLTIFGGAGHGVPLKQVADVDMIWEPARIARRDGLRTIVLQAQIRAGVTAAEVIAELEPWLNDLSASWPRGYNYAVGGETEKSADAGASIVAALPLAIVVIVLLLMLQFNSVRRSVIVLTTIPLGIIGITIGLLVTQASFGFFTLLGLVSLAGIIINNAIVLLDRIRTEIEENGLAPAVAIVQASQQRARPILLTTATTTGGMLPLWLGGGPMFETLAIAVLFGLLFATFITLLLVPVLYKVLFRVSMTAGEPHG